MLLKRITRKVTTLFIEDTAIRLLVAKGKHVEKWATVPLEPGLIKHGQVQDKTQLAEKLRDAFRWTKAGNKVILGLSEPGSLYRIIKLPKLPGGVLPEAIKREAERVIPLPQNEVYLSYQVISENQDEMQIFLTAFSRTAVDSLISTLQMAGLKPYSLDLVPLALCRVANSDTAIIVSLRSSNFEIAVMVNKIPQIIRSLALPEEEEFISDKLPTIAEELERTVTFYNSSHPDKPLDSTVPVFVDGDLAETPDSWQVLVGNREFTVTPLPLLIETGDEFDNSQFTVNIGLASKENRKDNTGSIINFNALPQAYLPEKTKISRIMLPIGAGVAILILIFVCIQANNTRVNAKSIQNEISLTQSRNVQTAKDVTALKNKVTESQTQIQLLQDEIDSILIKSVSINDLVTTINTGRNNLNNEINSIIFLAADTLIVSTINLNDTTVNISGTAPDHASIYRFARNLIATGYFTSLNIKSIILSGDSYSFSMYIVRK